QNLRLSFRLVADLDVAGQKELDGGVVVGRIALRAVEGVEQLARLALAPKNKTVGLDVDEADFVGGRANLQECAVGKHVRRLSVIHREASRFDSLGGTRPDGELPRWALGAAGRRQRRGGLAGDSLRRGGRRIVVAWRRGNRAAPRRRHAPRRLKLPRS